MNIANVLMGLLGVLTIADHVTTNAALKAGLKEANWLTWVIKKWGSTGLFITKLMIYGASLYAYFRFGASVQALTIVCASYLCVIAWNSYCVISARKS